MRPKTNGTGADFSRLNSRPDTGFMGTVTGPENGLDGTGRMGETGGMDMDRTQSGGGTGGMGMGGTGGMGNRPEGTTGLIGERLSLVAEPSRNSLVQRSW